MFLRDSTPVPIHRRRCDDRLPAADQRLILVDGVCKLCNAWSRFIIRHDRAHRFQLGSVQSPAGQRVLECFDMPTTHFETLLYIEGNRAYVKSDAFLRIVVQLGWPWKLFAVARVCPRFVRDWCYDRIARNRYRLFGRFDACVLPSADHGGRFLDDAPTDDA
jgi:predicted DCC family thiol-disulfide oxidoreductase YuxK